MKFEDGTRVMVIKNNTSSESWNQFIGTLGTVEGYRLEESKQPYYVRLDLSNEVVSFDEDELDFA